MHPVVLFLGCALAVTATKRHLGLTVDGSWSPSRAGNWEPNTISTWAVSDWDSNQTQRGGPRWPGDGWPRPRHWAKSATATFPNTPSVSALVRRLKKKGENGLGNFLGFQMQILWLIWIVMQILRTLRSVGKNGFLFFCYLFLYAENRLKLVETL
jgi:hypothetical protein